MPSTTLTTHTQTRAVKTSLGKCSCKGRRKARKSPCQSLTTDKPVERPDLAIYSQEEEIQKGVAPNWNSPDITTNHFKPYRLMEEVEVTVRNLSAVPATNAFIHFYLAPFGIGTRKMRKVSHKINLDGNSEVLLKFPHDQETMQGDQRIGVHVQIEHSADDNQINNSGEQYIDGAYTSESGRNFTVSIPVVNDSPLARQIDLGIQATDLIASVNPASRLFAPHEQFNVQLSVEVPSHIHGTAAAYVAKSVTLMGRLSTGELIGGVTRIVRIDN